MSECDSAAVNELRIELHDPSPGGRIYHLIGHVIKETVDAALIRLANESHYTPAHLALMQQDHDTVLMSLLGDDRTQWAKQDEVRHQVYGPVHVAQYCYRSSPCIEGYTHPLHDQYISVSVLDGVSDTGTVWLYETPQR